MTSGRNDEDNIFFHSIYYTVFVVDTSTPIPREFVFETLRSAYPDKRGHRQLGNYFFLYALYLFDCLLFDDIKDPFGLEILPLFQTFP
jgi:hypothetical protein